MRCGNCNTKHGCGCQARTASDGTACCSLCLAAYEMSKGNNPAKAKAGTPNLNPSNVEVFYKGPGVQVNPD